MIGNSENISTMIPIIASELALASKIIRFVLRLIWNLSCDPSLVGSRDSSDVIGIACNRV